MIVLMSRIAHQLFLGTFFPRHVAAGATTVTAPFMCTPIDLDVYGHMNNANYVRVAELARWRMLMESGLFRMMSQRRLMFLVVSQEVTYGRPIAPFQAYVVRTAIRVCEDDKWVYYTHTFEDEMPRRGGRKNAGTVRQDRGQDSDEGTDGQDGAAERGGRHQPVLPELGAARRYCFCCGGGRQQVSVCFT